MSLLDKIKNSKREVETNLKASQFFTDTNVNGYTSKENFLFHVSNLDARDVEELEQCFEYLKQGKRLNSLPVPRKDRADNKYIWCEFPLRRGNPGVKVILFDRLLDFIKDYQEGAFNVPFSLEELYMEAQLQNDAA